MLAGWISSRMRTASLDQSMDLRDLPRPLTVHPELAEAPHGRTQAQSVRREPVRRREHPEPARPCKRRCSSTSPPGTFAAPRRVRYAGNPLALPRPFRLPRLRPFLLVAAVRRRDERQFVEVERPFNLASRWSAVAGRHFLAFQPPTRARSITWFTSSSRYKMVARFASAILKSSNPDDAARSGPRLRARSATGSCWGPSGPPV